VRHFFVGLSSRFQSGHWSSLSFATCGGSDFERFGCGASPVAFGGVVAFAGAFGGAEELLVSDVAARICAEPAPIDDPEAFMLSPKR
jgi:hypothetical protein